MTVLLLENRVRAFTVIFLSPHTQSRFCERGKYLVFFLSRDGIFTLTLLGVMMLDEARGIRGTTP